MSKVDQRNSEILLKLIQIFSCGKVYNQSSKVKVQDFMVTGLTDILEKIIPLFDKYPIRGVKALDYADFCKIIGIINNKTHNTLNGINEIKNIVNGMNSRRKC